MRKIRLWIFLSAIWVAKKACYNGLCYDDLNEAKKTEWQHYNWIREDDDYYDPTI
jgi:hypothetical protein